jgi:hypothetical protein
MCGACTDQHGRAEAVDLHEAIVGSGGKHTAARKEGVATAGDVVARERVTAVLDKDVE